MKTAIKHFGIFVQQQALSCLFPVLVFAMLALSHLFTGILPRYDFMLIACLLIQAALYYTGIETKDEVLVICIFHLLGLVMELFKVHYGSWAYPEFAYLKIGGVPLYSGFMYASVASYMCQAWRRLNLQIQSWPNRYIARTIGILIYFNFFSNHFMPDIRYGIGVLILYFFRRSVVVFHLQGKACRIPTIISFMLIGFFIWLAENIATRLGAWRYAYQHHAWTVVNYQKISSWAFLVIVSFIIVAELKLLKDSTKPLPVLSA
ncbi:DUF817 domain-containing protein [Mucilaginibacter rubeus]|uniref:DUF817 domain-containing protein n=1 Tax=Mucilaginibacter rubeus TaxID=2027860 RepID=A0AAE6JCF9_9SPHI|nr:MULTISPECIES: DUF817 domain-containing protein [Mucilaginibacter]QEM02966.1 DUF817 domain-containing protein [Mucilaginibacter rubeus]QEM15583.1 DUF817 domain-containing protein [Mucilaginibacter gossypii]QTE41684.1 DUF817 domain-containing protein [Mucilaginibacter rubeus]QTE48288.1 DUF817 domain-containing protein [Mucilaginibacter rubeus]QTE59676.1 DUF817 domain-containing protein [Mucilaginibacter rubeus]